MKNHIELKDLYAALCESARNHTAADADNSTCRQVQTYRAFGLNRLAELDAENLGVRFCDRDSPYFYSRDWESAGWPLGAITWGYPLLYSAVLSGGKTQGLGKLLVRTLYNIEIGVIDVVTQGADKGTCVGCDERSVHDVFFDTQRMLYEIMHSLRDKNFSDTVFKHTRNEKDIEDVVFEQYDEIGPDGRGLVRSYIALPFITYTCLAANAAGSETCCQ